MNRTELHDRYNSPQCNHWDLRRRADSDRLRAYQGDDAAHHGAAMDAPEWLPRGSTTGTNIKQTGQLLHICGSVPRGLVSQAQAATNAGVTA